MWCYYVVIFRVAKSSGANIIDLEVITHLPLQLSITAPPPLPLELSCKQILTFLMK